MQIKGLKICFVVGTLGQGGAERQLFYIVQSLLSAGADVHVISFTSGEFWETPLTELGVKMYHVREDSKFKKLF